jgi:hypothetical protein
MLLVYMFLGVALAQASIIVVRDRTPASRAALALALVLMFLDFTPTHLASTPVVCSPALRIIANDPGKFGVLDLPSSYAAGNAAMMLSACHGKAIVQGETARRLGFTLADQLEVHDMAAQQRQLAGAHVKYIVLHKPQGQLFQWSRKDGDFATYARVYPLIYAGKEMLLLRVY